MKKTIQKSTQKRRPRVVCIGGGTGTFVTLRGMKHYPVDLTAIVTMSDSGGSNKRLRDEFGLLPTSDIRQCLVALSDENGGVGPLRQLFMYRFDKGKGISGMTFGNLFMAALTDILGSQKDAIAHTGRILNIHGRVIPVSYTDTHLHATYEDGRVLTEEHFIDEPPHDGTLSITDMWLKPKAKANPDALKAIEAADLIVLGPGDLYTSIIPNLLVSGIAKAIKASTAHTTYVVNLMTKYGQTYGYTAAKHVSVLSSYLDAPLHSVVYNTTPLPKRALAVYAKHKEQHVADDFEKTTDYTVIRKPVASTQVRKKASSDKLVRSLIRHDSYKLAEVLSSLI